MTGWTDTSGKAPLFDLIGTPVKHDFTVDFGGGDEIPVELKNLPVPMWHRFWPAARITCRRGIRGCSLKMFPVETRDLLSRPVVAATAAFNYFVTGRSFEKIVFQNHLPWVFQFGKDEDTRPCVWCLASLSVSARMM